MTGFLVGTDATAQDGILEFQTSSTAPPPPFNNKYLLGDFSFGVDEALDNLTANGEGYATAAASSSSLTAGTLNGNQDHNYSDPNYCLLSNCTSLVPEEAFAGSYSINSDGTGSFGGFNGETVSVTNGRVIFYLDESPAECPSLGDRGRTVRRRIRKPDEPKVCPKCKSPYWNTPRKKPLAKREIC